MKIDEVVLGSDSNETYRQFWPLIAAAWNKIGIKPALGYVGEPPDGWDKHGEVASFRAHPRFPDGNAAKLARLYLAMRNPNRCVLFSDLDMLPLDPAYFLNAGASCAEHEILNLCSDAYKEPDRYPICYWVGRGEVWREIFNPQGLEWDALLDHWTKLPQFNDERENPSKIPFSDESLFKKIMHGWPGKGFRTIFKKRGWDGNIAKDRIDRSRWAVNAIKLRTGKYKDAHLPRPLRQHIGALRPLAFHLGLDPKLLEA